MNRRLSLFALAFLFGSLTGCISLPWQGEKSDEVNLVFELRQNLIVVDATVDGRDGHFIVSSAQPRTILDTKFAAARHIASGTRTRIILGGRVSAIEPVDVVDLNGAADGILGMDVWRRHTLTVDYAAQVVTVASRRARSNDLVMVRFSEIPTVPVLVNGKRYDAIIDVASPDSVVLPAERGETAGRRNATIQIADRTIGPIDVLYRDNIAPRVGNRVLSRFLVFIDYSSDESGFWSDPRRPVLQR